eukprot:7741875-Pyramimonas_sp.AAC.1
MRTAVTASPGRGRIAPIGVMLCLSQLMRGSLAFRRTLGERLLFLFLNSQSKSFDAAPSRSGGDWDPVLEEEGLLLGGRILPMTPGRQVAPIRGAICSIK